MVTNGIGRVEGIAVDWIAGEPWEGMGLQRMKRKWDLRRRGLRRRGRRGQVREQ